MSVNESRTGLFKLLFLMCMKKNIFLVFLLMIVCATGVITLQFYFTYQNYTQAVSSFERDANAALYEAAERSSEEKCRQVAERFRGWLEDTSFIHISAVWDQDVQKTFFTLSESGPHTSHADTFSLLISIDGYNGKGDDRKPGGHAALIDQLSDQVKTSLRTNSVNFYTHRLGDSLTHYFFEAPPDLSLLGTAFRASLHKRKIDLPFTFSSGYKPPEGLFVTHAVNSSAAPSAPVRPIRAVFMHPAYHVMTQLKWMIVSSVVLVAITLFCFYYTIRTLLTQQKLARLKNDFISNMGHELHTPLCSISITAEALGSFTHDRETRQSYLDIILHQSRKLTRLTDELITAAKLEQTTMPLEDTIDLNRLMSETVSVFRAERGTVLFIPSAEQLSLKGNALHLSGALGNLIDNAIKYNVSTQPEVTITWSATQKHIAISVTDNGPGIPRGERERIFTQFYRIPTSNSTTITGYGLGLSYVKKVVAAHNGTIEVCDAPHGGSTFILYLPR
jgi:two-component system phosphate regulon sensor histidine kinase PhoR